MKIKINYFDEKFSIIDADFSKVQPFSHADVVVNCDQPLSGMGGILERKVAKFLSDVVSPMPMGIKAKWDKGAESYKLRPREGNNPPRISEFGMGIDFDI